MDYSRLTPQQLAARIEELEALNRELLNEKRQGTHLSYAWTHNLGHWYFDVRHNVVTYDPLKIIALGYREDEVPERVPYQFFTAKVHPEDYDKTMQAMLDHLEGRAEVYEVEYRILGKDGKYRWFYDRGKATQYSDSGKPAFIAGIVFDETEKREMQQKAVIRNRDLLHLASTDELTQIANRRTIMQHLQSCIKNAKLGGTPLTIGLFDLDNFKETNDVHGHIAGDGILRDVAALIQAGIVSGGQAGRYGGEEFLAVFPQTSLLAACEASEQIRTSIQNHSFINGIPCTVSGGLKEYDGEEIEDFIHAADEKLYQAKKDGRNQIAY